MFDWITHTLATLGYPGLIALMALENVVPPIPSELIMPLAGFLTTQDSLSFVGVVLAGMVGSVLGALPLYYAGRLLGEARVKAWADAYGAWLTLSGVEIERAEGWFKRHGTAAVFLCRLVPGIRSLISIPAGVARMPLAHFLPASALGTGLWAALLAFAGRLLGRAYASVETFLEPFTYVVLGLIGALWLYRVVQCKRRTRLAKSRA